MAKHGKKYTDTLKKAPKEPVALADAIAFIKANPGAKFDETVEVAMHLGVYYPCRRGIYSGTCRFDRETRHY